MTRKTKARPKEFVLEDVRPGVRQVRKRESWEAGTVKAERIHATRCTVCLKDIGEEPFVEVEGVPKYEKHLRGE